MQQRPWTRLAWGPLFLLGSLFAAGSLRAAEAGRGDLPPLRWAADAEGRSYIFKDPQNLHQYIGFEVDLVELLEKELGRRIEFHQYDFKSLVSGLQRGDFDFALNGLEITPDRRKAILFSRPYYVYSLQLVARADDPRCVSLEDCKKADVVIGTLEDTAADRMLDEKGIRKKVYDGQVEPYKDLELGRIDGVLLDLPIAVYYARPNARLKFVGPPQGAGYYAIGFRKDQPGLAAQFDAAIAHLAENGQLRRIYEKWKIWNDEQEKLGKGEQIADVLRESGRLWTLWHYFPVLLQGAYVTVEITFLSMIVAILIGLPLALARLYGPLPVRAASTVYVEFFRGIPVLLLLYFLYYGLPEMAEACRRGRELLARVGLADRADAHPRELSGGQKQRVAIARAMAMEPRGLLCDEITSALDPELKGEVLSVLENLKREGLTLLVVTHEIGFARRAADRIVVLDEGKIVEDGPPSQVLDDPQMVRTQRFLSQVMA